MNPKSPPDYFRRDQDPGITAPDLSKDSTYAEHVVRARGRRTPFTSLSLDHQKINDFGPTLYQVDRQKVEADTHSIVEHEDLMARLRDIATSGEKADRARALQAQRYARRRLEGLVRWNFDLRGVERKDLITWAYGKIQSYFRKL